MTTLSACRHGVAPSRLPFRVCMASPRYQHSKLTLYATSHHLPYLARAATPRTRSKDRWPERETKHALPAFACNYVCHPHPFLVYHSLFCTSPPSRLRGDSRIGAGPRRHACRGPPFLPSPTCNTPPNTIEVSSLSRPSPPSSSSSIAPASGPCVIARKGKLAWFPASPQSLVSSLDLELWGLQRMTWRIY